MRRVAQYKYMAGSRYHATPYGDLPGVTTILGKTSGFDFSQWRKNNPDVAAYALQRGITLHAQIEAFWRDSSVADSPLFQAVYPLLASVELVTWEHQVYSKLGFSGSLDALGYWGGALTLFDWKTSGKPKSPNQVEDYLLQVAAYQYCLWETDRIKAERCSVIVIVENMDSPQVFELEGKMIKTYFKKFLGRLKQYQKFSH